VCVLQWASRHGFIFVVPIAVLHTTSPRFVQTWRQRKCRSQTLVCFPFSSSSMNPWRILPRVQTRMPRNLAPRICGAFFTYPLDCPQLPCFRALAFTVYSCYDESRITANRERDTTRLRVVPCFRRPGARLPRLFLTGILRVVSGYVPRCVCLTLGNSDIKINPEWHTSAPTA
jgi:hypothetical protein